MEFHASWIRLWNRSDTLPHGDTMKNTLLSIALVALACSFIACDTEDPAPVPGTLTVNWKHAGVATCGARNIEKLRVFIAHPSDETLSTSQEVPCPEDATDGSVLFEAVMPATYDVAVQGFHADGQIYYEGNGQEAVADGADAVSDVIQLDIRQSSLHVEYDGWIFPCHKAADAGLDNVSVEIYEPDEGEPMATQAGTCDASFMDEASGETNYGVIFAELDPVDVLVVVEARDGPEPASAKSIGAVERAEDADGNEIELLNGNIPLKLNPGQHHKITVFLAE
jgi:hypothetical protein